MSHSLYEINQELWQLYNDKEEIDDEQAFKDTWESLQMERTQKIEDTLSYIKCLKSWAEGCKTEAATLKERADRYRNQAENLTRRLSEQLAPREKYVSAKHEIRWRESTSTAVTVQPEELPESYRRVSYAADKTAIKDALQAGATIPGCSLTKKLGVTVK